MKNIYETLIRFLAVLLLFSGYGHTVENPIVIYDNGKAINAQQFYPFKKPSKEDVKNMPRYAKKSMQQFPVVSAMLSVGRVNSKKIKNTMPGARAICVIGDDKQSKKWINNNKAQLSADDALCIVVNVESMERFQAVKALAPKIDFQALNGNIFAKKFNVKKYPFLINKGIIKQ